jgi:hypothetical protein
MDEDEYKAKLTGIKKAIISFILATLWFFSVKSETLSEIFYYKKVSHFNSQLGVWIFMMSPIIASSLIINIFGKAALKEKFKNFLGITVGAIVFALLGIMFFWDYFLWGPRLP